MPKDPVCGMEVSEKWAEVSVYKGKKYYFCDLHDKSKFDKSPEKYVSKGPKKSGKK
jgi:YHS domain-containing protein